MAWLEYPMSWNATLQQEPQDEISRLAVVGRIDGSIYSICLVGFVCMLSTCHARRGQVWSRTGTDKTGIASYRLQLIHSPFPRMASTHLPILSYPILSYHPSACVMHPQ